jgi:hypothetical protein
LGIGDWGLGPIPNPQSPIPNPQSPIPNPHLFNMNFLKFKNNKTIYILRIIAFINLFINNLIKA